MEFEWESFFERSNAYCSKCFLEMQILQESDSDNTNEQVHGEAKEGLFQKIWNTLKSMLQALRNTLQNAINSLTEKVQYGMLSKDSKVKFDNFVRACQQNPQLANKQIKVKDWKRTNLEYDKITQHVNRMMKDDNTSVDSLVMQVNQMLSHTEEFAKSAVVSLSVGTALKLTKECPEAGRQIQQALRTNAGLCKMIDDQLGAGYSKELDMKLKRMQKETMGAKLLTKIGIRKQKSIEDALASMGNDISALIHGDSTDRTKAAINNKETVGTFAKIASKNKDAREGFKDVKSVITGKGGINNHQIVQQVRSVGSELLHPSTGVNNNQNKVQNQQQKQNRPRFGGLFRR